MRPQTQPLKASGRPNQYFDIGGRGRKTGWAPTAEIRKDEDGMENIQDFFQEFPEEERRPQEFYYDEYEEFPRENYRYEGEYQYQERPIRRPIQVPVMRSPFVYEEPIRVQVTPQYVPRRSIPGSVPVRRVYQSPVYQQAPPKRYPPNPYLNQAQPMYKNYPEPPRSQPRPRQPAYAPERDEEYWRHKESEESEDSNSKAVIPLQIEAPPSPVKYSPVKHSPRPTASSSRSAQQKQKKKSVLAPKKDKPVEEEEEDVQPFRKRLGMTNRLKPTKAPESKPAPTLTAQVLEKDAVYPPVGKSPELTVEEVVDEEPVLEMPKASSTVVEEAENVKSSSLETLESIKSESPVKRVPAEHKEPVLQNQEVSRAEKKYAKASMQHIVESVPSQEKSEIPMKMAEPVKKKSKAKNNVIMSSSEDDAGPAAPKPKASALNKKNGEKSVRQPEESPKAKEEIVPATQFDTQSTNDYLNQDFNDDFGSPSGYPHYEPTNVLNSGDDANVSPVRSYAHSDQSIEDSPVKPPPKKRAHNEMTKKEAKPKSTKVKKEKTVAKTEFKRPNPVAPVVVHVDRPVIDESDTTRRSKRAKVAPVAFWKNEKVIYSRRESGIALQDVIRVPSDDEGQRPRKLKSKPREKVKVKKEKVTEKLVVPQPPPEMQVVNYATKQEEFQKIAVTPEMLETSRTVGAGEYKFQKVFSEGEFIASGVLELPVGARKPNKNSHSSAMVFIVMSGLVEVQVHTSTFQLAEGGQFFVPRGNQYSITNVGREDSTLIFCHGKQIA